MNRDWTPDQTDAIRARGGTLLVSAAAGSGKTAVLVQRAIERITDGEAPSDADRLLVVTFTRAAAAEMRSRIQSEVARLLEEDPYNTRLQRQQILLQRAHISTIDSFCSDLVRQNFYLLDVPPDFRILEESEASVLRAESSDETLEEYYGKDDPVFLNFVESFASRRDDAAVAATVGRLYDFIQSHPFPYAWLREKEKLYDPGVPAGRTVWGEAIFADAGEAADYGISALQSAISMMSGEEAVERAYGDAFRGDLAGLTRLRETIRRKDWDGAADKVKSFPHQKLKPLRGYGGSTLKSRVQALRSSAKDAVDEIAELFSCTQAQCEADIARLRPVVSKLFEVTERFSAVFKGKKREKRALDFSDLEHLALRLLTRESEGGFSYTPAAAEISSQYDEVMVDEYQDTNETQDLLFRAVSHGGKDLFLVGDVKQSIYGFRQAMPQIFLRLRAQFPKYDKSAGRYPACVTLDRNFRSRKGVADAVNFVFRQLMSRQAGELDYTKSEELIPAASYPPDAEPAVELQVVDLSAGGEKADSIRAECEVLAERIQQMTSGKPCIFENGKMRRAVYRDFCILLRSANRPAHEYVRELTALGVPAWAETAGGFFETYEVAAALSMLQVIDNPMQDIPLLSVLMGPVCGFTPDEMAGIRIASRGGRLYPAVVSAAKAGNARAAAFLKQTEELRTLAATMPSDRLIRAVFRRTGFTDLVQAMPNGELRLANLRLLLEYARKYESSGYNGLSGFLRFLDRMRRNSGDLSAASALSESANVVRVMSIHRSKGLEFPVCILAGCARRFNTESPPVLLHRELGLGIRLREKNGILFNTMPRSAVEREIARDGMSEELRVLYVAMTRAKEKLILVTALKNPRRTLEKLASQITGEAKIQPYAVRSAKSISDWLLLCALRHPDGGELRRIAGAEEIVVLPAAEPWSVRVVSPQPQDEEQAEAEPVPASAPDEGLLKKIEAALDFRYPFAPLRGVCAKVAASELAARSFSAEYAASSRPAFLSEKGLTPAERGTALHAYLQFADYRAAVEDPQAELTRLVSQGFLTSAEAQAVDLERVAAFFKSPVARRILASPSVKREFRFAVEIPAGRVEPGLAPPFSEEPVVLQGAADCVFAEEEQLVIVDFKTDRTRDPAALWEHYREQLDLYGLAVAQCTGRRVKQCLLYSFFMDREITGGVSSLPRPGV